MDPYRTPLWKPTPPRKSRPCGYPWLEVFLSPFGVAVFAGLVACILPVVFLFSCAGPIPAEAAEKAALYELDLTACTERSSTLTESIVCENDVRARQRPPRPPRALPKPLPDGGVR